MTQIVRLVIALAGLGLAAAIGAEITGDLVWRAPGGGGFIAELNRLMATEWGVVSLIDLYLGFVIAAVIVIAFERRLWVGLAWALPIFFLGNIVTAAWAVVRLPALLARLRG